MKRLTWLMAIFFCITVGGVYATWVYTQAPPQDNEAQVEPALAEAITVPEKGTITVDASSLQLQIDNPADDFVAQLRISGEIRITFTADAQAFGEVATQGLRMEYVLSLPESWQYEGQPMFTVGTTPQPLNGGEPCFSATISAEMLAQQLHLNPLTLPDSEAHAAFAQALAGGTLHVTVREQE